MSITHMTIHHGKYCIMLECNNVCGHYSTHVHHGIPTSITIQPAAHPRRSYNPPVPQRLPARTSWWSPSRPL